MTKGFGMRASRKKSKRGPIRPTRYSVQVEIPGRGIEEIAIGRGKEASEMFARKHWDIYGYRTRVLVARTGEIVLQLDRAVLKTAGAH